MKKQFFLFVIIMLVLSACSKSEGLSELPKMFPMIDSHPTNAIYNFPNPTELPVYDPLSGEMWQVDYRSVDVSALDLSDSLDELYFASFDSKTIWPTAEKIPSGFNPDAIMELGKNPGLDVRKLHEEGITGEGVGIAIIDQSLLVNHAEYANQLRMYEEDSSLDGSGTGGASMHGAAVASIAVGKTVGVAPEADLYYIGTRMCSKGTYETIDFACLAENVRRILQINEMLPKDRKIRVISMSIGWMPNSTGYAEIEKAVQEAKDQGIFVISTSLDKTDGYHFLGLGRQPMADPDSYNSYEAGVFWAAELDHLLATQDTLLIPMDSRSVASPTGVQDYVFYREGGLSWAVPYLAAMYALAVQVKPEITPAEFWELALQTGQTIETQQNGNSYFLGPILDPVGLIQMLQTENQ